MELGKRIKEYRNQKDLSQETLAESIYVSRQTISNWENDKSYPDVHSLVLLSKVLDVSLDQLIKGDLKMIKEQMNISKEDRAKFKRLSYGFGVMLVATAVTPIPLIHFLSGVGAAIWLAIFGAAFYLAFLAERQKKQFDMHTYKEIAAFMEGASLNEIDKAREEGKRPYQKMMYAAAAAGITLIISLIMLYATGM